MADHIKIRKLDGTWVIRAGGAVLGETSSALELQEGDYPAVVYFPRGDIAMAMFDVTDTTSLCPHKGEASYYALHAKSDIIPDAGWSYESPLEAVAAIKDHLAFYPDKVTVERV